ncbi:MAG: hypothetical protein KTR35_06355 [Gammaproteobacteria bacterium]|nr:hypothetical protein [Gammaproteobacteria bacterium]
MLNRTILYLPIIFALSLAACSSSDDDSDPADSATTGGSDAGITDGGPSDDPGGTDGSTDSSTGGTDGTTDSASTDGGSTDASSTDGNSDTGGSNTDGGADGSTDASTDSGGTDGASTDAGGTDGGSNADASGTICSREISVRDNHDCTVVDGASVLALVTAQSEGNDGNHVGGAFFIDTTASGGVYSDLSGSLSQAFSGDFVGCFTDDLQDSQEPEPNPVNELIPQDALSVVLLNGGDSLQFFDSSDNSTGEMLGQTVDFQGNSLTFYEGAASSQSRYVLIPGSADVPAAQAVAYLPGVYSPVNSIFSPVDFGNSFSWNTQDIPDGANSLVFITWHFERPNGERWNLDCVANGSSGQITINAQGPEIPSDASLIRFQSSVGTYSVTRQDNMVVLVLGLTLVDENI